jgi:hypothetical protein
VLDMTNLRFLLLLSLLFASLPAQTPVMNGVTGTGTGIVASPNVCNTISARHCSPRGGVTLDSSQVMWVWYEQIFEVDANGNVHAFGIAYRHELYVI